MSAETSEEFKQRMKRLRDEAYVRVGQERPDLYDRAVQIGHLALPTFVPGDDAKRAAAVEAAVMQLIDELI